MNNAINRLINFGLQQHLIEEADVDYAVNMLLDLLKLNDFYKEDIHETLSTATPILEKMLDHACEKGIIENSIVERDLFDTRLMNCLMPRNSEVIKRFYDDYQESCIKATKNYYHLSIASNYIRKDRTDKNISFKSDYKYGTFEITINLSKPEKDPKDIAKAKLVKTSGYPKCLLCKENVGFSGDINRAARQTHRIIPLTLDHDQYYLQYSPYVYYNEHCIVFNEKHIPMVIDRNTFRHLFAFVDMFPHYMLGSNADLPIVGGSILTHDHYQGGCYHFPIEDAKTIKELRLESYPDIKIEVLNWPLSTIRATSLNKEALIDLSVHLLEKWREYENKDLDIIPRSGETLHHTITPIARKKDDQYQIDLVLRNNRTSDQYPDGIFHPHQQHHHIKKENIGLIEVMGLAILPARLKKEMELLKECLLQRKDIDSEEVLMKHKQWYEELMMKHQWQEDNVDKILNDEIAVKFVKVLEDAGVFKMDDQGKEAFIKFVEGL